MAENSQPLLHQADDITMRVLMRSPRQCFWHGFLQTVPLQLVMIPFGTLFGIVAREAGMDIAQIMGFSVLVLAGASQFTAVQLLADNAPTLIVIVTALAVNLRMAMYSAALVPWLGQAQPAARSLIAYTLIDQTYALSIQEFEKHPRLRIDQRLAYFFGTASICFICWTTSTYFGATVGNAIPESWALDFAIPITFLAMIAPMLRTIAHLAAALVAIVAALAFAFLPSGLGLLVASPLAMATGASVETWMARRALGDRK